MYIEQVLQDNNVRKHILEHETLIQLAVSKIDVKSIQEIVELYFDHFVVQNDINATYQNIKQFTENSITEQLQHQIDFINCDLTLEEKQIILQEEENEGNPSWFYNLTVGFLSFIGLAAFWGYVKQMYFTTDLKNMNPELDKNYQDAIHALENIKERVGIDFESNGTFETKIEQIKETLGAIIRYPDRIDNDAEIKRVLTSLEHLKDKMSEVGERISKDTGQIEKDLSNFTQSLKTVETTISEYKKKVQELESNMSDMKVDLSDMKTLAWAGSLLGVVSIIYLAGQLYDKRHLLRVKNFNRKLSKSISQLTGMGFQKLEEVTDKLNVDRFSCIDKWKKTSPMDDTSQNIKNFDQVFSCHIRYYSGVLLAMVSMYIVFLKSNQVDLSKVKSVKELLHIPFNNKSYSVKELLHIPFNNKSHSVIIGSRYEEFKDIIEVLINEPRERMDWVQKMDQATTEMIKKSDQMKQQHQPALPNQQQRQRR